MLGLGLPEILIILIAVVILFSGGEKLSEIARGLGRFTGEFQKGKEEMEKEIKKTKEGLKKK
jgi:TatA/E family protein of Tat protein translocase